MRTLKRIPALALFLAVGTAIGVPVMAQQSNSLQNEADKGVKTQNSGASGYVGDQDKPGTAMKAPGQTDNRAGNAGSNAAAAPSAQNSGAGIAGQPGNKSGPAANKETVGSARDQGNLSTQEQDPSNVKGLPGSKSGPPAKSPSR
jgi:hypothetical protein